MFKINDRTRFLLRRLHLRLGTPVRYRGGIATAGNFNVKYVDYPSFVFQLKDIFVDDALSFPVPPYSSGVILDVGSNIGMSVLWLASNYPQHQVWGCEPDKNLYDVCSYNLEQNEITNASVSNVAAWTHEKGISFASDGADGGSVFGEGNRTYVPTVKLRNVIESAGTVDLLKIDIEGAEYAVLDDISDCLSHINFLFVECHIAKETQGLFLKTLETLHRSNFLFQVRSAGGSPVAPFQQQLDNRLFHSQVNIFARQADTHEGRRSK